MAASKEDIARNVKMAEQEMDYRVELYNKYARVVKLGPA
jgi:hypothetical protein